MLPGKEGFYWALSIRGRGEGRESYIMGRYPLRLKLQFRDGGDIRL